MQKTMGKKNKIKGGDVITSSGPLDKQIETATLARQRADAKKMKRKREANEEEYMPEDLSKKILLNARKQMEESDDEEQETDMNGANKRMRHISLGEVSKAAESEEELEETAEDYDEGEVVIDPKDEADLERFMSKKDTTVKRTLFEIIQAKLDEKKVEATETLSQYDPTEMNIRELDPEVVEMYREVGSMLSKYRGGKIPKAFKLIPKLVNWEQILYLTNPDKWSAAAMYQATRLFASNLNPRMCQRFFALVLLPRCRDDIDEFKKLNFHLYQSLHKALYKPAAFFKGILLPLCDSGTCTLREAIIFGSVLQKASIPMFHCAAAMLKIAEMEYTGASSYFLRMLIDKKYALPYKALDALVSHFLRFRNDDRELPVMWHQTLLALCQRYKNDLNDKQKHAIRELVKVKFHGQITQAIRFELNDQGRSKQKEGEQMEF
ncbi:byn-1 [Pristionchus pacificus]|uniref:Bystin n=1 Tax=Pristionchus pacificus TaxID=54126 RepID=A0A8R1V225_PRIPA|nr:byn-1 [Pristionchus pacificus]